MRNIYDLTLQELEEYFINIGEKNLKQHKYMNGYIEKVLEVLMKCLILVKKQNLGYKKNKLVDCVLDGTISKEVYQQKLGEIDNKIEKLDNEIESYTLLKEVDDKIENGILKMMQFI